MEAKAARAPSCERAGAGARASANSLNVGACVVSAETSLKPAPAPTPARSALVSKAMRDPSPLMVGLRLMEPGRVCRDADDGRALRADARDQQAERDGEENGESDTPLT